MNTAPQPYPPFATEPDPVWEGNSLREWEMENRGLHGESKIEVALRRAETRVRAACGKWKEEIRTHPVEAVMLAAAGGYVCHRLHSRALLYTGLKIFSAFTPPTLIALGLCKVAEFCKLRDAQWAGRENKEAGHIPDDGTRRVVVTDVS